LNQEKAEYTVREVKQEKPKGNEGLLPEPNEWIKSAQSIYPNEKNPSRLEVEKARQEPIKEVETDIQHRESQSSGDALFDNLNEVYGEIGERVENHIHDYYEYRSDQRNSTEQGSYVQVPTRGSETLSNGLIKVDKFPKHLEYEGKFKIFKN
jgi:hypothetical protein